MLCGPCMIRYSTEDTQYSYNMQVLCNTLYPTGKEVSPLKDSGEGEHARRSDHREAWSPSQSGRVAASTVWGLAPAVSRFEWGVNIPESRVASNSLEQLVGFLGTRRAGPTVVLIPIPYWTFGSSTATYAVVAPD